METPTYPLPGSAPAQNQDEATSQTVPIADTAPAAELDVPGAESTTAMERTRNILARLSVRDWLVLGCVLALFGPMFYELIKLWSLPDAPQAYGLLILPAAALLVWMLRTRLEDLRPQSSAWGLTVLVCGLGLLLLGTLSSALMASALGFMAVVIGIVWTRYGGKITRRLWFPLAFLLAMVPLPSEVLNDLTFPLQRLSIHGAALLLKPFGDVRVDGTQLHVGSYTLDVIAPCSGLTIVLPLLTLAVYYLYLIQAPLWKKALLTALTLPVAMGVNAVRVALIGAVGEAFGTHVANVFHDYSGILTVLLGFVALTWLAKEMQCHRLCDDIAL
jgi:exosortase